ncbi:MAG: VOC family protein, partial [Deltaproteobacteria bacterium]
MSDLERSLAFYRDVLGFEKRSELAVEAEDADRLLDLKGVKLNAVYLERDGARIELLQYDSPNTTGDAAPRAMNARGLTHISLRVDDLPTLIGELRGKGIEILPGTWIDYRDAGIGAVFITDPDGTRIELV